MMKSKIVATKADKEDVAIRTDLEMDLTNLSDEDILEYALQTIVIKWQGIARRAGKIPAKATYIVPRPGTKSQASLEDLFARKTPEEQAKIIADLQAKYLNK